MNESSSSRGKNWGAIFLVVTGTPLILGIIFLVNSNRPHPHPNRTSLRTSIALESAINSIYAEYGKLPDVGNRVTTNSPEGLKLLKILLGIDAKSDNALNSRAIKFLNVREGKNHKNGLIYATDGISIEGLFDSWGSPYTVILDTEYKEHLHFTLGSNTIDLKGRRAAAFSPGPDKQIGTADDVRTW
ncbi:MAG: hypothetical protein V4689_07965 [Verrucomicrobiota bacterium]